MNDLALAKQTFQGNNYAFVLVKEERVLATGTQEGVGELLAVVAALGDKLQGASLADKIVGKAVAMVAAFAGLAVVYTPLGSEAAIRVCQDYGILFQADHVVPLIRNKRNDGPCPMERLTLPLEQPGEAVAALREFVARKPGAALAPTVLPNEI
jgi:hypothetical protein